MLPPSLANRTECCSAAGVWNSYALPNNNEDLWASIWTEKSESGICTGLSPNEWMRRAVQLQDQYNPDVGS